MQFAPSYLNAIKHILPSFTGGGERSVVKGDNLDLPPSKVFDLFVRENVSTSFSKLAVSLAIHIPEYKGPFFQRDVVSMEEPLTVRTVSRDEAQSADPPHEGEEGRELTRLEGGSVDDYDHDSSGHEIGLVG